MHRISRSPQPRSDATPPHDSAVGKRRLRACVAAPLPRTQVRRYQAAAPHDVRLIRDAGFLPEQIQRVLRSCVGAGVSVLAAPAGARRVAVSDMLSVFPGGPAAGQASGLRLVPIAQNYDPRRQLTDARPATVMLSLEGRQAVHFRKVPLCYTILSDQPWLILLGGADLTATEKESVACAKISFPTNSLVQLSLATGMLHGFEGKFAGVGTGWNRTGRWGWPSSAPSPHAWPAPTLADPARVRIIADRAIPWELLQHWQRTVPLEKSADEIAWEAARLLLPM